MFLLQCCVSEAKSVGSVYKKRRGGSSHKIHAKDLEVRDKQTAPSALGHEGKYGSWEYKQGNTKQ